MSQTTKGLVGPVRSFILSTMNSKEPMKQGKDDGSGWGRPCRQLLQCQVRNKAQLFLYHPRGAEAQGGSPGGVGLHRVL